MHHPSAQANIPHYWFFNLGDRQLETYGDPQQISPGQFGDLNRRIVPIHQEITLPDFPKASILLTQAFPLALATDS